jgi:putative oxidoreductase
MYKIQKDCLILAIDLFHLLFTYRTMKNLFSVHWSHGLVNLSLLVLRVGTGLMLLTHGLPKLMHFEDMSGHFADPLHVGPTVSLIIVLISEIICAFLLVIGLLSRPAAAVVFVEMCIILLFIHHHDPFARQELAWHYLISSFTLLCCGPGRISIDGMISR